jgi:hypothetical protein
MQFKQINRDSLRQFRQEFDKDMKALGEKYGIAFSIGTIRFTDTEFHGKISAVLTNAVQGEGQTLTPEPPEQEIWNSVCRCYGLQPEDYGKTFVSNGHTFKLCKIKPGHSKYPIIATRVPDGKSFKFDVNMVRLLIQVKQPV